MGKIINSLLHGYRTENLLPSLDYTEPEIIPFIGMKIRPTDGIPASPPCSDCLRPQHKLISHYSLLFSSATMSSYSTPDQVNAAADEPGAVFLDVRTGAELKEAQLTSRPFHHITCSLDDCSELMARAEELMRDKNGTLFFMNALER